MSTPPEPAGGPGLTGPHPNPLSSLILSKSCGAPVSLHRFAGRWVILRVTTRCPLDDELVATPAGLDCVPLNVVIGPHACDDRAAPVVSDLACVFADRFPAIDWPATFVIDPEGRLVAILDDSRWPRFLAELLCERRRPSSFGTIDLQDIMS